MSEVTGRRGTGRKGTGGKTTGVKERVVGGTRGKEKGVEETGGKTTGVKERGVGKTGGKEKGLGEKGGKTTGVKERGVGETGGKGSGQNVMERIERKSYSASMIVGVRKRAREKESSGSLRERYGKKDPPTLDRPTEVKLGIYINSFHSISEQTMDFMISFYLRQSWIDPRLQFTPVNGTDQIHASYETVDLIWTPDVFFRNEKRAAFHHVTQPNILMRINSNGGVWFVRKISAKLACPMDLQKYPMDKQTCPMMFESFGYTMDTMYFSWLDNPVDIDKSVELPQFTLETYELYDCSQNYTAGAFPCLEIKFVLQRAIGFFLIQVYIPSILIVILSWVSFWISIDAIPARVSLGLLTVLTMTTQSTSANNSLPKVSYIKAIDVWMSMCLVFVFIALLEFALVNVISRKGVRTINPARRPPPPPPPQSSIRKLEADGHTEQVFGVAVYFFSCSSSASSRRIHAVLSVVVLPSNSAPSRFPKRRPKWRS
ncbi:Glycine receptor subunit alpha-2 [Lamellibrachia satsuma]|nr:Glycine receptor subunit alpha-2 [Lamellibrachia satsuma]